MPLDKRTNHKVSKPLSVLKRHHGGWSALSRALSMPRTVLIAWHKNGIPHYRTADVERIQQAAVEAGWHP